MLNKLKLRDNYVIKWQLQGPMQPVVNKSELISIAFDEVKCEDKVGLMIQPQEVKCEDKVGLIIQPQETKYDNIILWITTEQFFHSKSKWLYEAYVRIYPITGVVFHHEKEADAFKYILEKRFVWEQLKN